MSVFAEFSVPVTAFPSGEHLARSSGVSVEFQRAVPAGRVEHQLWLSGEGRDRLVGSLRADPSVESVDVLDELPDGTLMGVRWERVEAPLFDVVEATGATVVEATGTDEGLTVTLRFTEQEALSTFYETARRRGIEVELREILGERPAVVDDHGLSAVQRETLAAAFEAGYFDVPRRTTISDLAERLGVSDQAVSERLRRGLARVLAATVGEDEPGER
jgi:predicted DNA binding protein